MENPHTPDNRNNQNNKPTDSAEIVRRHLEDENHEITDEDIRNVRIVPENDAEPTIVGAEAEAKFDIDENDVDKKDEATPDPNNNPVTPWNVVK